MVLKLEIIVAQQLPKLASFELGQNLQILNSFQKQQCLTYLLREWPQFYQEERL